MVVAHEWMNRYHVLNTITTLILTPGSPDQLKWRNNQGVETNFSVSMVRDSIREVRNAVN